MTIAIKHRLDSIKTLPKINYDNERVGNHNWSCFILSVEKNIERFKVKLLTTVHFFIHLILILLTLSKETPFPFILLLNKNVQQLEREKMLQVTVCFERPFLSLRYVVSITWQPWEIWMETKSFCGAQTVTLPRLTHLSA